MASISKGLAQAILTAVKTELDLGFINFYGYGTATEPPADASASVVAAGEYVLVLNVSLNDTATGLTWTQDTATDLLDSISKAAAVWSGTSEAASAATPITFFRVVGASDTGALSTTEPRVQGTVASSGTPDFFMSNTTIPNATLKTISAFTLPLPFTAG